MLEGMPPVTYAQLIANGWTRHAVRSAVSSGSLRKLSYGWYEAGTCSVDEHTAASAGLRVGCLTGLRELGVWVPPTAHPHMITPRWSQARGAGIRHVLPRGASWPRTRITYGIDDCLRQALRHHDVETGLIVLESAANLRLLTAGTVTELIREAPPHVADQLERRFDPRSESGTETRVRLFLARRRYPIRPQVVIPDVGRVDLLVGESLIIECDSRAHHTGETSYASDRRRDLRAAALGYTVIRLTWEQVFLDWDATRALLLEHLRTRRYRRPPARVG
jgi:very-short-patch-repair endonuclease